MPDHQFVLTLSCPDRPGIVSAVSTFLAHNGQNILDAQQFDDEETGRFFMRVVFTAADSRRAAALQTGFAAIARALRHGLAAARPASRRRVMLLVSKSDHCLADMLYRWRIGELAMDPDRHRLQPSARHLRQSRFRRHPVPPPAGHQGDQARAGSRDLAAGRGRPAPIWWCSRATCRSCRTRCRRSCRGRCINIHHSFLPGFKGARPYHQAHERGVKLIGATAHYVTARPRRRPDHRAGRRAHQPSRHARGPGPQGPRHRAPRAGPRHALAPRGPRAAQRPQDRGVHGLNGADARSCGHLSHP